MEQSKRMSLIEATSNVVVGYIVSLVIQLTIFPLFGVYITLESNIILAIIFTIVSIIRSYTLRRIFSRVKTTSCKRIEDYTLKDILSGCEELVLEIKGIGKPLEGLVDEIYKDCPVTSYGYGIISSEHTRERLSKIKVGFKGDRNAQNLS